MTNYVLSNKVNKLLVVEEVKELAMRSRASSTCDHALKLLEGPCLTARMARGGPAV